MHQKLFMMINKTLVTYAFLEVLSERKEDIIDIHIPLISSLILENSMETIDRVKLLSLFKNTYEIENITHGAIESILERMKNKGLIKKEKGKLYPIIDKISKEISPYSENFELEFKTLISNIIEFAKNELEHNDLTIEDVERGLLDFLSFYNGDLILDRPHLEQKLLNTQKNEKNNIKYIISKYIIYAEQHTPQNIEILLKIAKGHIISDVITLPNFNSYIGKMKSVKVALDAPIIFNLLGLNGDANFSLTEELMALLRELGVNFILFNHNYNEVINTIQDAIRRLETNNYDLSKSSRVLRFAIRNNKNSFFIKTKQTQLEDILEKWNIKIFEKPELKKGYKDIDCLKLSEYIRNIYSREGDKDLEIYKEELINTDVDTISYIFRMRGNKPSNSLKNCNAIMVTTNTTIANASRIDGISEITHIIPVCVTDIFLSTILWLNFPKKNEKINNILLMSQCYNNVALNDKLLAMYYTRIEKMEKQGVISKEQVLILRTNEIAFKLLEKKTMNSPEKFTDMTTDEILEEIEFKQKIVINNLRQENETYDKNLKKISKKIAVGLFWIIWIVLFVIFIFRSCNYEGSNKYLKFINILITIILPYWALLNFGKLIPPKEKIIHLIENKIYNSLKNYFKCTK